MGATTQVRTSVHAVGCLVYVRQRAGQEREPQHTSCSNIFWCLKFRAWALVPRIAAFVSCTADFPAMFVTDILLVCFSFPDSNLCMLKLYQWNMKLWLYVRDMFKDLLCLKNWSHFTWVNLYFLFPKLKELGNSMQYKLCSCDCGDWGFQAVYLQQFNLIPEAQKCDVYNL